MTEFDKHVEGISPGDNNSQETRSVVPVTQGGNIRPEDSLSAAIAGITFTDFDSDETTAESVIGTGGAIPNTTDRAGRTDHPARSISESSTPAQGLHHSAPGREGTIREPLALPRHREAEMRESFEHPLFTPDLGTIVALEEIVIPKLGPNEDLTTYFRHQAATMAEQAALLKEPILVGYVNLPGAENPHYLLANPTMVSDTINSSGQNVAAFPRAAKGPEISPRRLAEGMEEFKWVQLDSTFAPPTIDTQYIGTTVPGRASASQDAFFIDRFTSVNPDAHYAFFVKADSVDPNEVQRRITDLTTERRDLLPFTERNLDNRVRVQQLEHLINQLRRGLDEGYWKSTLIFGAPDEKTLRMARVIAAEGSSVDRKLRPSEPQDSLTQLLAKPEQPGPTDPWRNFMGTDELTRFLVPPREELGRNMRFREEAEYSIHVYIPKETPRHKIATVAEVLDGRGVRKHDLQEPTVRAYHELFNAQTDMGKTELALRKVLEYSHQGIPSLMIDNKEGGSMRRAGARLAEDPDVPEHLRTPVVIRPGDLHSMQGALNPLQWEPGIRPTEHIRRFAAVLVTALEQMPSGQGGAEVTKRYIDAALFGRPESGFKSVYELKGWHQDFGSSVYPGGEPPMPTMFDLLYRIEEAVQDLKYLGEAKNLEQYCRDRIASTIRGEAGRFFMGPQLDISKLVGRNVIVELDGVTDPVERTLIGGMLTNQVSEHHAVQKRRSTSGDAYALKHFVFIDDARPLLTRTAVSGQIDELLANVRDKGVKVGLSVQGTDGLAESVITNIGSLWVGRLRGVDAVRAARDLGLPDDHYTHITKQQPGEFMLSGRTTPDPVWVRTFDPRGLPGSKEKVATSAESLINLRPGEKLFTPAEQIRARELLDSTEVGKRLIGATAELTIMAEFLSGKGVVRPHDSNKLWDALQASREKDFVDIDGTIINGKRVVECAIRNAVRRGIETRADLVLAQPDNSLDINIAVITDRVLAVLSGEPVKTDAPSLQLDSQRYSMLRGELARHMTRVNRATGIPLGNVERHPDSEAWETMVGCEIKGKTAAEQLSFLRNPEYRQNLGRLLFQRHPIRRTENLIDAMVGQQSDEVIVTEIARIKKAKELGLNPYSSQQEQSSPQTQQNEESPEKSSESSNGQKTDNQGDTVMQLLQSPGPEIQGYIGAIVDLLRGFEMEAAVMNAIIQDYSGYMTFLRNISLKNQGVYQE